MEDKQQEHLKVMAEKFKDVQRVVLQLFNNEQGEKVLEYLDTYSHLNFPNFENVNATYHKIGQQQLVDHLKAIIKKAKEGGV